MRISVTRKPVTQSLWLASWCALAIVIICMSPEVAYNRALLVIIVLGAAYYETKRWLFVQTITYEPLRGLVLHQHDVSYPVSLKSYRYLRCFCLRTQTSKGWRYLILSHLDLGREGYRQLCTLYALFKC